MTGWLIFRHKSPHDKMHTLVVLLQSYVTEAVKKQTFPSQVQLFNLYVKKAHKDYKY